MLQSLLSEPARDFGLVAQELAAATPSFFQSTDEALRSRVADIWKSLIKLSTNSTAAQANAELAVAILEGKHGKLTSPEQRILVIGVLALFANLHLAADVKSKVSIYLIEKLAGISKTVRYKLICP